MKINEAIGDVIRELRQEKQMTLQDLASDSFVSFVHISEVERAKKNASPEVLESLALGLRVPTYHIVLEAGMRMELAQKIKVAVPKKDFQKTF
jgi:transcriptional regulator with XRE-family HTH domain